MSSNSGSVSKGGSAHDSDSSSGFKAFWKRSDKESKSQDLKFVQQDPGVRRKKNRISRILKHDSTPSSHDNESEPLTSAQKRRQQVYQAQKRHRDRNAEYVGKLEAEVARLQHLDAVVSSERNAFAHQNKAIKEFLAKQSIDTQLSVVDLNGVSNPDDETSQLGGAFVDFRMDTDVGHERIFLDMWEMPDVLWTSSEASTDESQPKPTRHAPVTGDSWAALDFILALEWPCRTHVRHAILNPNTDVPTACANGNFHGHGLTATQAVMQSALPSPSGARYVPDPNIQPGLDPSTEHNWSLPHSEIDKLVELAELLELDDEIMTPAQAYSAVRETVPDAVSLRPTLQALKKPLGSLVECQGFGACMDAGMFWSHLEAVLQTPQSSGPSPAA